MNLKQSSIKSDIEKINVFEILFLHYAISFNCLRPKTGISTQKHKNRMNTLFKLILRTKNTWDGLPNTGVKTSKFKLKNKITERYAKKRIYRNSKININKQLMSILCKKTANTLYIIIFKKITANTFRNSNQTHRRRQKKELKQEANRRKVSNKNNYEKILKLFFISDEKMSYTLKIYNELIEEANNDEERVIITNYLGRDVKTIEDNIKEDAGHLNEAKRYWTEKGNIENDTKKNEVATSIYRLINMYGGIRDYLNEMESWWKHQRNTPPILFNFHNGPENSVFLKGAVGYYANSGKKRKQTRMGLIELELITQYLDIVAGKSERNKKVLLNINKYLGSFKPKTVKLQITNTKCTHNLICNHLLILLQRTLKRLRTLDPYWTDSSLPCEFQEHLGKML